MIEELPNPNQSTKPLCFNLWAMGLRSRQLAIVLAQKLARCSPPNDLETVHHIITHQSLCRPDPVLSRSKMLQGRHHGTRAQKGFHQSDLPRIIHEETKVVRILQRLQVPKAKKHTAHISPYSHVFDQDGSGVIHDHH